MLQFDFRVYVVFADFVLKYFNLENMFLNFVGNVNLNLLYLWQPIIEFIEIACKRNLKINLVAIKLLIVFMICKFVNSTVN